MKYYQKFHIDNLREVQQEVLLFLMEIDHLKKAGFVPLNRDLFREECPITSSAFDFLGLKISRPFTVISWLPEHLRVHIDYINPEWPECRINIPILNCEGTRTEFYSGGNYTENIDKNGKVGYLMLKDDDQLRKEDEVEIDMPTVIRVQVPHRVNTDLKRVPRVCLTCFMNKDPVFMLN